MSGTSEVELAAGRPRQRQNASHHSDSTGGGTAPSSLPQSAAAGSSGAHAGGGGGGVVGRAFSIGADELSRMSHPGDYAMLEQLGGVRGEREREGRDGDIDFCAAACVSQLVSFRHPYESLATHGAALATG